MGGMSASADTRSPELSTGSHIVIFGADDEPRSAIVVKVRDGLIWISGSATPGEPDERVSLLYSVPGDAQYWSTARVELVPPETLALRRTGPWSRQQRRALPSVPIRVLARAPATSAAGVRTSAEKRWLAAQRDLAARFPGASLKVATKGGHHLHLDAPELVVDTIREVLESVVTGMR